MHRALLQSWETVQYAIMLYNLVQYNAFPVNPFHFSEGYASTKPLYQANNLRVESAIWASLFTIHPKIDIGC